MSLPLANEPLPAIAFEWPLNDFHRRSFYYKLRTHVAVAAVGCLSRFWLYKLERAKIFNRQRLMTEIYSNHKKRPLITVCNHISCFDEPTIWGMLDWKLFFRPEMMRWSLAAHDVCFTTKSHQLLFSSGKCVPVVRGYGVYQKAMDFCVQRLSANEWVHIFPEGKVNMDKEWIRLKWGVGRLIAEPPICPLVLPMWIVGFDEILPNTEPPQKRPRLFKNVSVAIGRPVDFSQLRKEIKDSGLGSRETRKLLTDKVEEEMKELKELTLDLHSDKPGASERFNVYLGDTR